MDLLDYYRGRLSPRRLRVLIRHLPRESALVRALHGDVAGWGIAEHLLAGAVDELAVGNWLFVTANSDENAERPERPRPVPRPGVEEEEEVVATTPEQLAAFFGAPSPGGGR
ncbi:hypothetical protein [Amycolatopsis sp. WAC 04182]|uniref:hypothetical protein n=1 Tax=Amycolatopsis sp. WAC 04182 TaxID=2203198 RepID=UPI0018F54957|nr:hypothetical protein [Amycolatopsis sp. WAC 04182]